MKLLIITQVVDSQHPVLGFFHRWIEEFATRCEHVHVICLQAGEYSFPQNVTVHSLGKESNSSRLQNVGRCYSLIWSLRREYDSVFVHMNQEYILLGGMLWRMLSKKILFWRNHYAGSFLTHWAAFFCDRIFYTSNNSYTRQFEQSVQMPIGIDPAVFFLKHSLRTKHSLLYVGRVARSKNIDLIIKALPEILKSKPDTTLTVVGPLDDTEYVDQLQQLVKKNNLPVTFAGPVSWGTLPQIYSGHELCINMSPPGMFDKVIGEAILCGCDILTTNTDLRDLLKERVIEESVQAVEAFVTDFSYSMETVSEIKHILEEQHSLQQLVKKVLI